MLPGSFTPAARILPSLPGRASQAGAHARNCQMVHAAHSKVLYCIQGRCSSWQVSWYLRCTPLGLQMEEPFGFMF